MGIDAHTRRDPLGKRARVVGVVGEEERRVREHALHTHRSPSAARTQRAE